FYGKWGKTRDDHLTSFTAYGDLINAYVFNPPCDLFAASENPLEAQADDAFKLGASKVSDANLHLLEANALITYAESLHKKLENGTDLPLDEKVTLRDQLKDLKPKIEAELKAAQEKLDAVSSPIATEADVIAHAERLAPGYIWHVI